MNIARIALALAFVGPAAAQCSYFRPDYYTIGLYEMGWHGFRAYAHHIEFVPYSGGIAAVVMVTRNLPASPYDVIRMTPYTSCGERDLTLIGWAWSHASPMPGDQVGIVGSLNGNLWRSPTDDLVANRSGFRLHPGITMMGSWTSNLGAVVLDQQGYHRTRLDLTAYLIAPASGSW